MYLGFKKILATFPTLTFLFLTEVSPNSYYSLISTCYADNYFDTAYFVLFIAI